MDNMEFYRAGDMLAVWGPRILGALLIVIVAHFVAKAVQWTMARLIDRFPGAASHNRDRPPKETLGYQLGQLGYWLVLLIGVIAALSVLQLTGVVGPLNTLTMGVLSFVPNLIGAAVIFFVGLVVATLARRVVEAALGAARVDHWLEKAGLGRLTGATNLGRTAGHRRAGAAGRRGDFRPGRRRPGRGAGRHPPGAGRGHRAGHSLCDRSLGGQPGGADPAFAGL